MAPRGTPTGKKNILQITNTPPCDWAFHKIKKMMLRGNKIKTVVNSMLRAKQLISYLIFGPKIRYTTPSNN